MNKKKITIKNDKITINETYGDQANTGNIVKDIASTASVLYKSLKRGYFLAEYLVKLGVTIIKGESIHDLNTEYGNKQRQLSREVNSLIDGMSGAKDTKIFMSLAVPSSTLLQMSVENGPNISNELSQFSSGAKERWNSAIKNIYQGNPPELLTLDTGSMNQYKGETSKIRSSLIEFNKLIYMLTGEKISIASFKNNERKDKAEVVRVSKIINKKITSSKFLENLEKLKDSKIIKNNMLELDGNELRIFKQYYEQFILKNIDASKYFKSSSDNDLNEFSGIIYIIKNKLKYLTNEDPSVLNDLGFKINLKESKRLVLNKKEVLIEENSDDVDQDQEDDNKQSESSEDEKLYEQINKSIRSAYMIPKFALCYLAVQTNYVQITMSAIIPRLFEKSMLYFLELVDNIDDDLTTDFDESITTEFEGLFNKIVNVNNDVAKYIDDFIDAKVIQDFIDDETKNNSDASESIEKIKTALSSLNKDMLEKTNEINQAIKQQANSSDNSYKIEIYQSLISMLEKSKPLYSINIENKFSEYEQVTKILDISNAIEFIENNASWYNKLNKKFNTASSFVSQDKLKNIKKSGDELIKINNEIKKINIQKSVESLYKKLEMLIKDLKEEAEGDEEDSNTETELIDDEQEES